MFPDRIEFQICTIFFNYINIQLLEEKIWKKTNVRGRKTKF